MIEQFGNYRHTGEIEGTKFSDNNGNGVWDVALGEEPLDNWTFQCYYENGTLARERLSGIPDPGVWEFYLPYGNYTVKEVNQSGYRPTLRAGGVNITIDDVQNHWMNIDFGNQPLGGISGYKVDNNGNPLANWNISISNTTYPYFNSTLTDGTGAFNFTDVPIGVYWLNETLKDGWTQITPNRTVEINITTRDIFNQNFTNQLAGPTFGNISGFKLKDPGLTPIANWNINLYYENGTLFGSQSTSVTGAFSFDPIPFGNYTLNETLQMGWTQTGPVGGSYQIELNGTSPVITNQNFTNNQLLGNISGYKIDLAGTGLSGWTIVLENQTLGTFVNSTNVNGLFSFTDIPWGIYTLGEVLLPGWTQDTPNQTVEINATSLVLTNLNFTNHLAGPTFGNISGYKLKDPGLTPLNNWNINLYYENGTLFGSQSTSVTGAFSFDPIPFGNYTLNETLQTGWTQTGPVGGSYQIELNGTSPVITNQNFTNNQLLGNLSGYKNDLAGTGLSGWTIVLENQTLGTFVNSTNGNGLFSFTDIPWGIYTLNEVLLPGWTQDTPNQTVEINATSLVLTNLNFTNHLAGPTFGNISGYKLKDPGLTPLNNWIINLYYENRTLFGSQSTSVTGAFSFDPIPFGNYTLNETLQTGWTQTGPVGGSYQIELNGTSPVITNQNFTNNQLLGNLSGYKNDLAGTGLSGWTIVLENQTLGTFVNSTNGNGLFSFTDIPWGIYTLGEVLLPGWTQDTPNQTVEINATSLVLTNLNFTNHLAGPTFGNISGYKLKDPGLTPLNNWNINLYYENGTLFGSQSTSVTGAFSFDPIPFGNYTLNETLQTGWTQTGPVGGSYQIELNGTSPVITNQNFTNYQQLGNVSGYKLNLTNLGQNGWTITLANVTTPYFASTSTNTTGGYSFTNVPWGIYTLGEVMQPGWTQVTLNRTIEINGTALNLVNQNFTNRENPRSGNISGSKYNDLNGNGIKEINDVPIPGVVISLYYQNGTLFGTQTTNADGVYVFDPVPHGTYTLNETVPSGWKQTQPASGNYAVEVNSTNLNFTRLFGNQEIPNLCACPARAYFTWAAAPSPAHTIQFTDGSPGNIVYWLYNFGDGKYSIARNPLHVYPRAGTYTVKLSAQSCDCAGKKTWTYYSTTVTVP